MRFFARRRYLRRHRLAIARHESAHAVVARALGLPVLWVSIVPGQDPEERIGYPAACKIANEAEQDLKLILTAMAAPAHISTGDKGMDDYSRFESWLAYRKATEAGLDPDQIALAAEREAQAGLPEIESLAKRLVREGRVDFRGVLLAA